MPFSLTGYACEIRSVDLASYLRTNFWVQRYNVCTDENCQEGGASTRSNLRASSTKFHETSDSSPQQREGLAQFVDSFIIGIFDENVICMPHNMSLQEKAAVHRLSRYTAHQPSEFHTLVPAAVAPTFFVPRNYSLFISRRN